MYKIISEISVNSSGYKENYGHNIKLLNELDDIYFKHLYQTKVIIENKFNEQGKLTVRERVNRLIDKNSSFLELSSLAAFNQYNNDFPSAGIIIGVGKIHGISTVIVANDSTVKGGTYIKETIKKHLRAQEIALENNLPCVYLVDSGGIFLPEQANVFADKFNFGRIFYNQAVMSAKGIPQISVVLGSCTAGGAYIPAMSDETIIVRNQGTIFIGGPPLVKAATGETISAEELGGGAVHTSISGVADHLAENDIHALEICRNIFESIPKPASKNFVSGNYAEPDYYADELFGIVPKNYKSVVNPKEYIARIVDGSEFHEFKENYGVTLVTGFSKVMGNPVGIIGNNGFLDTESSLKGAHFIELCNFRKIPIVFLQNITGFIVGKTYEHRGIARDGSKMVHAVANSVVPKFTIITGNSFGAGNYAMNGRAYNPRLLFLWPNARTAVMGGEQAAEVLVTIKKNQFQKNNNTTEPFSENNLRNEIITGYENESSALYSTSRLWDDGIINPAHTRKILSMALELARNVVISQPVSGIYRM